MTNDNMHGTPAPKEQQQDSSLAIVSLVLGIVSMTGPGLLLGIPAIITGAIALKKNLAGRGLSVTGLVLGIISTVASLLFIMLIAALAIWAAADPDGYREVQRGTETHEQRFDSSQT